MTRMNINVEDVARELGEQPYQIRCTPINNQLQLEDISEEQKGIELSFLSTSGIGANGYVELLFDDKGYLARILVKAKQ